MTVKDVFFAAFDLLGGPAANAAQLRAIFMDECAPTCLATGIDLDRSISEAEYQAAVAAVVADMPVYRQMFAAVVEH